MHGGLIGARIGERAFHRCPMASCSELVDQLQDRRGRGRRTSGHLEQALAHHQPQAAGIGLRVVLRQREEDGRGMRPGERKLC